MTKPENKPENKPSVNEQSLSQQTSGKQKDRAAEKFTRERVTAVTRWAENLFSFTLTRPASFRFTGGQFARIGIEITNEKGESERIFRAYSVVSSPFAEDLDFFSIVVPKGAFTSRLTHMQVGDEVLVEKVPYGFLTLARYQQPAPHDLWLLATGTGLAPFLSILQTFEVWQQYQRIVLVYSVRTAQELAYQDLIFSLKESFGIDEAGLGASFHYVPVVTREKQVENVLFHERIPALLTSQKLQQHLGFAFSADTSHIMLCGNPQMVEDTKETLKDMGLTMNRRGEGNIAVENYW